MLGLDEKRYCCFCRRLYRLEDLKIKRAILSQGILCVYGCCPMCDIKLRHYEIKGSDVQMRVISYLYTIGIVPKRLCQVGGVNG